ncbi:hypothetical protein SAMN04488691_104258 [Haloferax larsenii]|uniref:Uncharacterized protein n=1 Tax=Haloferax larsenii TaxID=302484 RepID=A0A1H7Q0U7_HALLR|nr:hypothetical protein SAMN04488691_104258 [Haloferax larsenii]
MPTTITADLVVLRVAETYLTVSTHYSLLGNAPFYRLATDYSGHRGVPVFRFGSWTSIPTPLCPLFYLCCAIRLVSLSAVDKEKPTPNTPRTTFLTACSVVSGIENDVDDFLGILGCHTNERIVELASRQVANVVFSTKERLDFEFGVVHHV